MKVEVVGIHARGYSNVALCRKFKGIADEIEYDLLEPGKDQHISRRLKSGRSLLVYVHPYKCIVWHIIDDLKAHACTFYGRAERAGQLADDETKRGRAELRA